MLIGGQFTPSRQVLKYQKTCRTCTPEKSGLKGVVMRHANFVNGIEISGLGEGYGGGPWMVCIEE
jgi:hypothetical protein